MAKSKKTTPRRAAALSASSGVRTGMTVADLRQSFLDHLLCTIGRVPMAATPHDAYTALALTVRDRVLALGVRTTETYIEEDARVVAYLSAEYPAGAAPRATTCSASGSATPRVEAMSELGLDLDELIAQEEEPGLGNGGLGRLASCFMDSLASLEVPAIGYGIRYEFGIFDQAIRDGWQVEVTDKWLRFGNPWEIGRPEIAYDVKFGGRTESWTDEHGRYRVRWMPGRVRQGRRLRHADPRLPRRHRAITLRLWKAEAVESFDFAAFNLGDYYRAVEDKMQSENITKVLYPNDEVAPGQGSSGCSSSSSSSAARCRT